MFPSAGNTQLCGQHIAVPQSEEMPVVTAAKTCIVSLPGSQTALGTVRLLRPQQFSLELRGVGAEDVPWDLALLSLEVPGGLVKITRKKLTPECPWCLNLLVWRTLGCNTLRVFLILFIVLILTYTSVTNNQTKADSHRVLLLFMLEYLCGVLIKSRTPPHRANTLY